MTNADDFDADVEQTGGEEFSDATAAEADSAAAAPAPAKSGGGMAVKLLVLLVVLAGGAAGAIKMGFIHSPVDIPGLTPAAPAPVAAATPASSNAPVEVAQANAPSTAAPQPVSGPDASPPAMTNISPRSGEKPAEAPAGEAMMPPPVASSAAPGAPGTLVAPAAPALNAPEAPASAPPLTPEPMPAMTPPALTSPAMTAPAMTAPAPEAAAPPAVGNADDAAKLQKLDDRITALEQSVKDMKEMKDSLATKSDVEALKASIDKLQQNAGQAQNMPGAEMPGEHTAKHVHAAKPAARPARHGAVRHASMSPASTKEVGGWVLKSAKPGTAWISKPGSPDIRSIGVGDTLPGVGKVTSISQDSNGHWIVNGTRGHINQ